MRVLDVELLSTLQLGRPGGEARPWSAASGLVRWSSSLYVVADDELGLAEFRLDQLRQPGRLWPLLNGTLPQAHAERKARKPDFEVLTPLPATARWPYGALLALGSGATTARQSAVVLALDAMGQPQGSPQRRDAAGLFAPLRAAHPGLNIEGACLSQGRFWLAQRGQPGGGANACIEWSADAVLHWLQDAAAPAPAPLGQQGYELGELDGVPLGFTDLCALPDGRLAFSAAAEASDHAYADGAVAGSVLGWLLPDGQVEFIGRLPGALKVEGIAVQPVPGGLEWLLVTDADTRSQAAQLLRVRSQY